MIVSNQQVDFTEQGVRASIFMEVINLADKQVKLYSRNFIDSPFFREYFRLFNTNTNFMKDTSQLMQTYSLQDISDTVSFLESLALEMIKLININLNREIDLGIITFFGDCSYDGHGILIDGKPYVFFDLNAIIPRLDVYNFRVFIIHEMLHSIHYHLNPDFYRENYRLVEEKYLKLMLAEGIATHLSFLISKEKVEDAYWFGYLKQDQVWDWIRNCEKIKDEVGNDLRQSIDTGTLDNYLYNRLFGIDDFKMLTSYRVGYYYGAEIVKGFLEEREILMMF